MEFASEMLVRSQKAGYRIEEVPVRLRRDLRSRPPHLRTWPDGWRHLRFLLAHSPGWIFLVPAVISAVVFGVVLWMAVVGPLSTGNIELSYRTSLVAVTIAMVSGASAWAFVIGRALVGVPIRSFPYSTEVTASVSLLVSCCGAALLVGQYAVWADSGFGELPVGQPLLMAVLGVLLLGLGGISFFFSLLYGLVKSART